MYMSWNEKPYDVVSGFKDSYSKFLNEVNEYVKHGYKPVGGVTCDDMRFYQAVFKESIVGEDSDE